MSDLSALAWLAKFGVTALPSAGRCMVRMAPGRIYATFHPDAPAGQSECPVCHRLVMRGMGRWWR